MAHDREIAGIRCTQILEGLSDYLAGELPPETVLKIEAHLAQCDWCEHFGGEFSAVVQRLRAEFKTSPQPSEETIDSLLDALNLGGS